MAYQITLPDGSIGLIDDSVPRNRAMEAAQAAYPDAFPGIGEQLLGAPGEFLKGIGRGLVDPVTGLASTAYTGLRAAGLEMAPFAETGVGKGLAGIQEYLAPDYGTVSEFVGALGGLSTLAVPGTLMAKGLGRAATLGGMATGLGAEEARSRVEQARAEGIDVSTGQEFAAQLGGTAIGLTELAPIERLTGPLQAVLRGVKKSDADMIAPGLFNSAKRMVETGGIEGLQEGMANVAQDLLAKGIYNPELDIGESALGDAAMGASVGAFAQGVIELVTKGKRKTLYDNLKAEEDAKTRIAEAEKARLAQEAERKKTLENFGVEGQPLLLAAPQAQVTPSKEEKSALDKYGVEDKALFEPFGTFSRDELDPTVVKELDKRRKEAGRPKTESFTIQDIADTGVYRAELDRLLAQRSGFTGDVTFKPAEIVGLAQQKNIDTSTQGFSDFVSRVTGIKPMPNLTGANALRGLNDVELFAVREALNKLPNYEQPKILPTGKSAKIFDEKQANKTLTSITKTLSDKLGAEGLGETTILQEIGDFSGLEDANDQRSLLEKYINEGKLERTATPAYGVFDAKGNQVTVIKGKDGQLTQAERVQAQRKAQEIGGTVKGVTINNIKLASPVNRLIGGADIREGVYEDDKIDGYDITTETGEVIGRAANNRQAEVAAQRVRAVREQRQQQLVDAKQKIEQSIAAREQELADLEALGQKNSEQYSKIQSSVASQKRNLGKVEQNLQEFGKGVTVTPRHTKQKRTGYTLFQGNKPIGTYNSRQEAMDASVVGLPTDKLEAILDAFPTLNTNALPGKDRADIQRIQQVASQELAARTGQVPSGVGVTVEGDITAAEERLALQGIFSPRIKERVNELDKKLRAALDGLGLKDVRLNIVGAIKGELGVADGAYAARLIKVALDAENPMRVLRHESIHALKELGAFTPDQWRVLENKAKSEWVQKYNIMGRYQGLDPASMIEEAIADAFSDFSQTKPPAGLIRNIFDKIKAFFTRLDNAFKGLGFQTADDVFTQADLGRLIPGMGERAAQVQGLQAQRVTAEEPERYSLTPYEIEREFSRNMSAGEFSQIQPPQSLIDLTKQVQEADAKANYPAAKAAATRLSRRLNRELEAFARQVLGKDPSYNDLGNLNLRINQLIESSVPQEKYSLRPRKLKSGEIVGSPPNARTEPQRTALVRQMTDLLRSPFTLLDESKNWYEDSGAAIRSITRGDPELTERVVRLMALYSQANGVGANTTATIKSIYQLATGQPTAFAGRFPNTTAERIPAILAAPTMDDSLPGVDDKLMNFYRNLHDATFQTDTFNDASTIDRWMMRLFGYPHNEDQDVGGASGLSNTQYLYAKDLIRRISDAHFRRSGERLLPRQIQAALWTYVKNKTDYDSLPDDKKGSFEPSIIDFSDYITRATANITWETRPSTKLNLLPGIHKAPRNEQEAFNRAVREIFVDENGNDLIFQLLGGEQLYSSQFSMGAYENQIAPNIITKLVLRKDDNEYLGDAANKYASIVGYVTKQDAVPWYRADPTASGKFASAGFRVTPSIENVDPAFEQRLFDHLNTAMPGVGFTRIDNAFDFVNFRGEDGKPFFMADKKYKEKLQEALESFPEDVEFNVEPFRAESAYISNNWKENANGEGYLSAFSPEELANIQNTLDGWRSSYDTIADQFGRDFGWNKFSLRSPEPAGGPSTGSGVVLGESQPGAKSFTGTHYGKQRVDVLSGSFYGTGIKGAEAARLAQSRDFRIKKRVYFYVPFETGTMPRPEAGLGNFVYKQTLNNILPPGEIMSRLYNEAGQDANEFESAIVDAGYDGYAVPSMGMMVVLNHDVPVEFLGTRDTIRNLTPTEKFSLRTTDTPEFKQWFGKSTIVDAQGRPKVMYHGTARDITEFKPKRSSAIFVTPDPKFAYDFGIQSEDWMVNHATEILSEQEIKKAIAEGITKMTPGLSKEKRIAMLAEMLKFPIEKIVQDQDATEIRDAIKRRMPSRMNIVPLYVRAENPFDFENPEHLKVIRSKPGVPVHYQRIKNGEWSAIEEPDVQDAIKESGFDGFYMKEGGRKNLAVYEVDQVKSVTGNIGSYGQREPTAEEAAAFGMTKEEAKAAQKRGDIRYSLRQTNTPEFKQWFKDSKVVDENNNPKVVYHGTSKFEGYEFKPTKASNPAGNIGGYYFSTLEREADEFAGEKEGSEVIPVFLSISNPYIPGKSPVTDAMRKQYYDEMLRHNRGMSDEKAIEYANSKMYYLNERGTPLSNAIGNERDGSASAAFQRIIKAGGYDGYNDGSHWVAFEPSQIKSAIGNQGTFSSKTGDIRYSLRQQAAQTLGQGYLNTVERTTTPRVEQGLKDRIAEAISPTKVSRFRQMFINKYEAIEVYSRELAKKFGNATLLADTSAISAALMSDRAAGVAAESFKSGIPVYNKGYTYVDNMNGKVKGLMDILMPLAQKQDPFVYQMFQDYAGRRRGVRLDAQGKVTPFTPQELAEIPKIEKAFPEFKQVFEDYQRYNEGLVRYMRDTGVIDAKAAQEWMKYGDYIPFYRQLDGERTVGPSIFSAISGVKAPKKLKGGDAPLGEFLETVIRNSRAAIEAGMRNVAATRVVNNFQRLNSPSGVGKLVERVSEKERNLPDVVTVRENGKDAFYQVADPLLVQSMQALNIPQIPGLDILAKPAEFLREMVTRDPAFIGASVLRESLSAWITTGQRLTPVVDGVKQFGKILANASPEVSALRKAGIGSGYEFKGDVQATAGEFSKQLKQRAGDMSAAQRAVKPISWMWDSLDKASTAADLSTRAEVFKRVMEETGNEAEAIYQAMEVINFSRKGSSPIIQIFAAIIPFLNARIQGLDLLYRAGFGRLASATKVSQQKAFMIRSLALLGTTAMYYALVQDDEEWQRADQETRDNYWIIGGFKFPIPFELGVMFKVIPERIMAYTMGDDTGRQVRESIARQVMGTLAFNPIPQAVLPLIEASANYSFFLQRDIVGMGKRDLAPEFQTSEGTSKIAIELGQTLGISPMKIDYVLRGYTGSMGTYAITAMDSIIRSEDDATKATWRLDQIPVLKRFMISDLGAGTVNDYYDLKDRVDEVVRTSNQLERTGDVKALSEYLKENGQVLGIKDYVRDLEKDMKSIRESKMAINMSRMEPDQKREALDALRRAEISLTERVGTLRKSLGV